MPESDIVIKGAREHNLRGVDVVLPRDQLICLTGVSGSGKSSLAFDTVYAEGQRRYVESLSSFARQFLGQMPKPDVDQISGLSPSISISQKSAGNNPRSTVGTITEIYDFLRVLYARVGDGHCPRCDRPITAQSREQIIERILSLPKDARIMVMAPVIRGQKGEHKDLFEDYLKQGFARARVDGDVVSLSSDLQLDRQMRHDIEIVVDRLVVGPSIRARLAEAVESAIKIGRGNLVVAVHEKEQAVPERTPAPPRTKDESTSGRRRKSAKRGSASHAKPSKDFVLSIDYACTHCGVSFEPPSPQLFSFNSPQGMCLECDGLGEVYSFDVDCLIPDANLSFKKGCIELIGPWKKLGRWKRHIYKGVASTMERILGLDDEYLLKTPWRDLDPEHQRLWLWGTGETNITYTWRGGKSPMMYGGKFLGVIPELLDKYRSCKSRILLRKLEQYMSTIKCPDCHGKRLNEQACAVTVTTNSSKFGKRAAKKSLAEICNLPVSDAIEFFEDLDLDDTRQIVATEVLKEIRGRFGFLHNVGLDYLTLDRTAPTLSGGESQRIRLAGQIGCGLVGVLYILDEPSIGLHPRDNDRLIDTLCELRDLGNTVVVVEHDEDTMRASDHVIDFGPGPGVRGGELVAAGTMAKVMRTKRSVTGQFLSGKRAIEIPEQRRLARKTRPTIDDQETEPAKTKRGRVAMVEELAQPGDNWLSLLGAAHNNLKEIDVHIPLGSFVCITGVSGSGKSSLVSDILIEALRERLNNGQGEPGTYAELRGLQHLDKMIAIDQSPIGRTPRSNPGTYIKLFDEIRTLFSQLPAAKQRGFKPGRFSFNVEEGRCDHCEGNGSTRLEMDFLADVWVTCPICQGHRFKRETLAVKFKEHSIADVLEMDIQQALELFDNQPKIRHKLQTLHDVGLDYLKIGQPSPTLSGGEAQRIKLARELVKKSTGRTLYMLDEPTTGLHFADIQLLLEVLHRFVDAGNTVVVVEHNLDVIKTADWVIDLGPEGGAGGGQVVVAGTPEKVAASKKSYTGRALARVLKGESGPAVERAKKPAKKRRRSAGAKHLLLEGAHQHNLKKVDISLPREKMSTFCGPSGSGKSSLAMDTIYAEGQRRYVESLSSYARQFVSQMQKPQLEKIEGLSPAIAIEQQNLGSTPRSTVGTSTEIYDYLRILFARLGTPHCPDCSVPVGTQTVDQVVDKVMAHPEGTKLYLMAPVALSANQTYEQLWEQLRSDGFHRIRVNRTTTTLDDPPNIDRRRRHRVDVIVDRAIVKAKARSRIAESVEVALSVGDGVVNVAHVNDEMDEAEWRVDSHSQHRVCEECGRSFEALTPHSFSFNSHLGWCEACEGLGTEVGANPASLFRSRDMTLADGALLLWPNVNQEASQWMLAALARQSGIPYDVPFDQLDTRQRRRIFQGTGDKWHDVYQGGKARSAKSRPLFRFQFRGLYPALERAARLSPTLRQRLGHLVGEVDCSACAGGRLRDDASAVRFEGLTIDQLCRQPLGQLKRTVAGWKLTAEQQRIAGELLREIRGRVQFLNDVGLDYLTLSRGAATLSGGEAQRIRLASQLGSGLCGVLYVLDEPTIGLHPRDNHRLLGALHKLRDLGNTLVLVEHDREVIAGSDHLVDFGPGAGREGGQVVANGSPSTVAKRRSSVTGPYLSGKKSISIPNNRRITPAVSQEIRKMHAQLVEQTKLEGALTLTHDHAQLATMEDASSASTNSNSKGETAEGKTNSVAHLTPNLLTVLGARHNNLKSCHVSIPLGTLTAITGVSGSGKSSLMNDVLYNELARTLHRASLVGGTHDAIRGLEEINKVVRVDQQPLGNSPTSNPATYTGVFELIRSLFAQLPESKLRGYTARRFSFNVSGGRCEECEGNGQQCIEMHFLPDVWVPCETCQGRRYNHETLEVKYHGRSISDVLEMTCAEALKLFRNLAKIRRILQTLCDVGLDYLTLGQAAPTLSGGEAQRVKLAAELARPDTGRTLYLLDEPTTGLHFDDLAKLLKVLNRLVDLGNTVVVIEHNLDVIKTADWVIDMGPEAGENGGMVTAVGTPEEIVDASAAAAKQLAKSSPKRQSSKTTRRKNTQRKADLANATHVSLTGVALTEVLAAGPYEHREAFDPEEIAQSLEDDLEIAEVGQQAKMPWEVNGPRWHTKERVGRRGEPCRWDGRILAEVIERIENSGKFSPTNWNARTIVEVAAKKKSHGWFLHAITGEAWLLKLKFRTSKKAFRKDELIESFPLRTLNEMEDLPVYSNDPRVKVRAIRGPWQEAEFRLHSWQETDRTEFWDFLDRAIEGFVSVTEKVAANPEEMMPWKKLGKRWHLSPRGFPVGKKPSWDSKLLDRIFKMLENVADGEYQWTNQKIVHLHPRNGDSPWATIHTKRVDGVEVSLTGPKGRFGLGRIAELCDHASIDSQSEHDVMRLVFDNIKQIESKDLQQFLNEHFEQTTS